MPKTKSRRKCAACRAVINVGDPAVRLRLKKSHAGPCTTCHRARPKVKYFHEACAPTDINAAMGYDPGSAPTNSGGAVPPPPKPASTVDLQVAALIAIETALKSRVAGNRKLIDELDRTFRKYSGAKALFLRGVTDGEQLAALKQALKQSIDLAF